MTSNPLTSTADYNLDDDGNPLPTSMSYSYLQGKSAPTTPGILSRSPSSTRLPRKPHTHLTKSKSSSHLLHASTHSHSPPHKPTRNGRTISTIPHYAAASSSEWLLRAALKTTEDIRESKGQSWLVARSSSTSLVDHGDDEDGNDERGFADDEYSPVLPRSRIASRGGSRVGSRYGSRVELMTPGGGGRRRRSSAEEEEFVAEPDFVDVNEDEEQAEELVDEAEMSRLTRERGFGLGGWVDRLVGWTLFSVEEDGEVGNDVEQDAQREGGAEDAARQFRRGRDESERVVIQPPPPMQEQDEADGGGDDEVGDEGGWADAAWLLSVAAKIIS
ncbi:MAG: hypothetical protein M1833_005278 [Piccolia ochrophora]|nr:MAG: hypothetical protein M1833_005278 [Piccolia ochrophora]